MLGTLPYALCDSHVEVLLRSAFPSQEAIAIHVVDGRVRPDKCLKLLINAFPTNMQSKLLHFRNHWVVS